MSNDAAHRRAKSAPPTVSEPAAKYAAGLIEQSNAIRLIELFARGAGIDRALYRSKVRRSIQVAAITTDALREDELMGVMRYRLAQYLAVHFVDLERIHDERIEYEPLDHTSPQDVHIIAGDTRTGEILCYVTIKKVKGAPPGATFRDRERPLFPVEEVHGWGIFNRLRTLPDMPVDHVREVGRFVKNQRYQSLDERSIRAPVETSLALWHVLEHELRPGVDAFVGDFEEGIAQQRLAYFHVPMAVLHGTVPYEAESAWLYRRYRHRTVFPFAVLLDDLPVAHARNKSIDWALSLPGKLALVRLNALRKKESPNRSSLEPPGGLPAIDEAQVLTQPDVAMADRLRLISEGERLRRAPLFADLSVAEAAVLGTKLERVAVEAGTTVLREGDEGDALFVVEEGTLEVRSNGVKIAELEPGDHFGEIALVTGEKRMADVVSVTRASLFRLGRDVYLDYLAALPDIEQKTAETSAARLRVARAGKDATPESVVAVAPSVFDGLTAAEVSVLGNRMERVAVPGGVTVIRQGDAGDALYLVESGDAEVIGRGEDGRAKHLATLGPGAFFGEIALLRNAPRNADVVARTPLTVLRLGRAGFEEFLASSGSVRARLEEMAAKRAGETSRRLGATA